MEQKKFDKESNAEYEIKNGKGYLKDYYNNGKLKFEKEYLNGDIRKEKELSEGCKLKFEIDYLKGKKWNGKLYDQKGNIEFEINSGQGTIKEYYNNGELAYEGDYLNGERNGKWKEYD